MTDFITYINNLSWYSIIDLVAVLAVLGLLLWFFKRRNNLIMAIILVSYTLIFVGVAVVVTLTKNNIMYVTYKMLQAGWIVWIVAFCVVYQQDLKSTWGRLSKFKGKKDDQYFGANTDDDLRAAASEIVKACQTMSKNDIGALIVIAQNSVPSHVLETGTTVNALISSGLMQSIFNTKAPLHDGAVMIKDNCILAAGCFLPLTQRADINKELGTRHRAAIGITEESDVVAIVVSEETGVISIVAKGEITRYMTPEKLLEFIESTYGINYVKRKSKKK